jgi:23S rRNA pseudouridine1911/1915/1917 synthase
MGWPIVGDLKYGSTYPCAPQTVYLHHRRMEVTHPVTKETITIEAKYPFFWNTFMR